MRERSRNNITASLPQLLDPGFQLASVADGLADSGEESRFPNFGSDSVALV
jgi:hypothetical protein